MNKPSAMPSIDKEQRSLGKFEELDAYRGIAALLIVVFHAYQYSREGRQLQQFVYEGTPLHILFYNLEVTVAWFFVLSGFLIFLPFARAALEQGEPQSARNFLIRRAIRIVPLYYAAVLIVWALRYSGDLEQWRTLLKYLTFTQVFDQANIFSIIGPAWSLANEMIFYLFAAILGFLAYYVCVRLNRRRTRTALLTGAVTLVLIGSVAYKWWAHYIAHLVKEDNYPVYFGPVANIDTFAIGMLLAITVVATRNYSLIGGVTPIVLRLTGVTLLVAAFALRLNSTFVDLYIHTFAGIAFVLILASTVLGSRSSIWQRFLSQPMLQFIGLISYGVYIWHEPLLLLLANHGVFLSKSPTAFLTNALLLVAVSIVVSTLSYLSMERPTLRLRYLLTRK